jgi:transcriptional antiterminator NusG
VGKEREWSTMAGSDEKLIARWMRRNKGPKLIKLGVHGVVRFVGRRRQVATACQLGGEWYALKTYAKGESAALESLRDAGLDAYLPEYKVESYNRRRRVNFVVSHRMFPRYLFVRAHPGQISVIRACEGVEDVLPGFPFDPIPLSAKEAAAVEAMREAQAEGAYDETTEARRRRGLTAKAALKALRNRLRGKGVRVTDGPFLGYEGTVEAVDSLERVRVLIAVLGRATPVALERGQVEELA